MISIQRIQIGAAFLAAVWLFTGAVSGYSQDDNWSEDWGSEDTETWETGFAVYGYIEDSITIRFPGIGNSLTGRLKSEWNPVEEITVYLEGMYENLTGISNTDVLLTRLGLNPCPGEQTSDSNDNYRSSFTLDHFWGAVNFGAADLSFGKLPVAWGSGYLFNPTDKLNTGTGLGTGREETPGTIAVVPAFYLGPFAFGGYLSFDQKGSSTFALPGSADAKNLPFGVRIRVYAAGFDFAAGFIKEVRYTGSPGGYMPDGSGGLVPDEHYRHTYWAAADVSGMIGPVGVYGEAALAMPQSGNLIEFEEMLEAAVGFNYTFPPNLGGITVRLEYAHLGMGEAEKSDYTVSSLVTGSSFLGEDYLLINAGRIFGRLLDISVSSLLNLNDMSLLILPEFSYPVFQNLTLSLTGILPLGVRGSEFDGRIGGVLFPDLDLFVPEITLKAKVSF